MLAIYCLSGMRHWGQVAYRLLDVPLYEQCPVDARYDTVFVVGMYDPPAYQTTLEHTRFAKRRVIMWCGSDVMWLSDHNALPDATHLCDSEMLRQELFLKGVEAKVVPWPALVHPEVAPLPETPRISMYLGHDPQKYGRQVAEAVFEAMAKRNQFEVFTYSQNDIPPEDMPQVIADSTCHLRLTEHDGGAMSAREYLEGGRYVVCTADIPYAKRVRRDDIPQIASVLCEAIKKREPHLEAAEFYRDFNSIERWKKDMEGVL